MSLTTLAEQLDSLHSSQQALISESRMNVIVSGLSFGDTMAITSLCAQLTLRTEIYDQENTPWQAHELSQEFAPYRIIIVKPVATAGSRNILTNIGLSQQLHQEITDNKWFVARLSRPFSTLNIHFLPYGVDEAFQPAPQTKSPRSLVREYSSERLVPEDVRPWVLKLNDVAIYDDPVFRVWADVAIITLSRCLPDEIDPQDGSLKFKGPPRLNLPPLATATSHAAAFGVDGFIALQNAIRWVFESEHEAEMRHVLLAAEIAQSGDEKTIECLKSNLVIALDGAKIAYQISLSDLSRDTLKILADLRKAITEDTSKLSDATRQTIAATAASLAVGIGLIAARLTTDVAPIIITTVMLAAAAYVLIIILSGIHFLSLQKNLRDEWKPRLYRFLPDIDYNRMVKNPAKSAEIMFWVTSGVGFIAILVLAAAVISTAYSPKSINPTSSKQSSVEQPK